MFIAFPFLNQTKMFCPIFLLGPFSGQKLHQIPHTQEQTSGIWCKGMVRREENPRSKKFKSFSQRTDAFFRYFFSIWMKNSFLQDRSVSSISRFSDQQANDCRKAAIQKCVEETYISDMYLPSSCQLIHPPKKQLDRHLPMRKLFGKSKISGQNHD